MKPEFNRLLAHREAMRLARKGDQEKGLGNLIVAKQLYLDALFLERQAAMTFLEETENEPTRSVIFRSAASLAYLAQEYREAEKLIAVALAGNTPPLILEQLRDLLESVNFERHLQLRGIVLSPNEFQMSIAGNGIGLGIAPSKSLVNGISVFPNPATNYLTLRSTLLNNKPAQLTITDMLGKMVLSQELQFTQQDMMIPINLMAGNYVVNVWQNNQPIGKQKIIVQ